MNLTQTMLRLTNSLHKQFPEEPINGTPIGIITALRGETVSFQALLRHMAENERGGTVIIEVQGASGLPQVHIRRVAPIAVRLATHLANADEYYLRKTPGLYPDRLAPYDGKPFHLNPGETMNFWLDLHIPDDLPAGDYPIVVCVRSENHEPNGREMISATVTLSVVEARLPQQEVMCTHWFHSDCLADYYNVEVFSEEYWRITEQFMRAATACGNNMILTPTFTPALDTYVGGERTTVQLVDVSVTGKDTYTFAFNKLRRWVDTARRAGFRYFEIAHLFSQWGAKFCPKVMAETPNGYRRIFGWETAADSPEYIEFLKQYLSALTAQLYDWGIADRCRFHLSDEPHEDTLPHYLKLRRLVEPYLRGFVIMDALSEYKFYEQGAVDVPVVCINRVKNFIEHRVSPLWVYYCCGPVGDHVSNRFIAMPSSRNRMLGFQMYLERAVGFLHWGFNFYNGERSMYRIDPFTTADCDGTFPAGDPFLVYPGPNGEPQGSIRQMVFAEAMQDHRACCLLEQYMGRTYVADLLREAGITSFYCCPDASTLLKLRTRINLEIRRAVAGI